MHPRHYALAIINDLFDEDLDPDFFDDPVLADALASVQPGQAAEPTDGAAAPRIFQ